MWLTKCLRKQGMNQPVVGAIGINHPRFITVGGTATDGVFAASDFFSENPKPEVAEWAAEFVKRFGDRPSNAAGEIYDTLYLMRECIKSTGVTGNNVKEDRVKLRDCWAGLKDAEAPLTGATSMDKNGDGTRIPTVLEVKDGKFPRSSNSKAGIAVTPRSAARHAFTGTECFCNSSRTA